MKYIKNIKIILAISLIINVFFIVQIFIAEDNIPSDKKIEELFEQDDEDQDIDVSKEGIYQNTFAGYRLEYPTSWKVLDVMGEKANSSLNFVILAKNDINQIPYITIDNQIESEKSCNEIYDQSKSSGVIKFDKNEFVKDDRKYAVTKTRFDDEIMNFSEVVTKYQYWDGNKCFHISVHDDLQETNKNDIDNIIKSFRLN